MISLDQWKQSAVFEPDNPGQQIQEHYTGLPGGYSSFYWNRVPTQATLQGLRDAATASGIKTGLLVAGMILALGSGFVWLRNR
jgi:hypothetical protein